MEEELRKLLLTYSRQRKIADENYLKRVLQILESELDIDSNINSIQITPNTPVASYNASEKTIKINIPNMTKIAKEDVKKCSITQEYYYYTNIQITLSLIHEIIHAVQDVIIKEPSHLATILYYGKALSNPAVADKVFGPIKSQDEEFLKRKYEESYIYNPCERQAYIISTIVIEKVIKNTEVSTFIKKYINRLKRTNYLEGYQKLITHIIPPTYTYLKALEREYIWRTFPFYSLIPSETLRKTKKTYPSLEERLLYGLPISNEEYQSINKKLIKRPTIYKSSIF